MTNPPPDTPDSLSTTNEDAQPPPPQVLIVGASARAAAFSAIRAGIQPVCLDQFADSDLQAVAPVQIIDSYPDDIVAQAGRLPELPVIYTGAMENHPDVLDQLAQRQPIIGNTTDVIAAVRNPFRVKEALEGAKMPCLDVRPADDPPPADGTWLLKPLHGSAGRGITMWDESAAQSPTLAEPHYFQKYGHGDSISAVFVAAQDPLQVKYVGLTRQLIGRPELNAAPFGWCGSIGPIAMDTRGEILIRRAGTVLAHQFGLRGIYGCDFIRVSADEPMLTEVNPRYTSSVEVLETFLGATLFEDHCRAAGLELPAVLDASPSELPTGSVAGKVVLFSDRDLIAPDTSQWHHVTPWAPLPGFADLPQAGSLIRKGGPVCTILCAATTFAICEEQLLCSAEEIKTLLADCPAPDSAVENGSPSA